MTRIIKRAPMRLVLMLLLLLIAAVVEATDMNGSPDTGGTRAARRLGSAEPAPLFPCVYTAVLPKVPASDPAAALVQTFVAQLDMLKEIPHADDTNFVEPAFLVRNAVELDALIERFSTMMVAVSGTSKQDYTLHIQETMTAELRAQLERKSTQARQQSSPYSTIADFPCYKDLQGTFDWMATMVTKAETIPNLSITLTDIGDSYLKTNSNNGYDIIAMKITGNGAGTDVTKAVFFAMTGIHAREYAPPELASRWAERLIDAYGSDADITAMLDRTEIHLVLQANPDGRHVAETNRPVFRRKNMNPSGSSFAECEDVGGNIGVDLNRNFPFQWGLDSGSSSDKCGQTYRGIGPASEPEVKAIVDYCASIYPQEQRKGDPLFEQQVAYDESSTMGVFFDIHAYGSVMIWPWSYENLQSGNDAGLRAIVDKMRFFNGYTYAGAFNGFLYFASGTTLDWAYAETGAAGFAIELGTSFYEQCSYFEQFIFDQNANALTYAAKVAMAPYNLSKGPDVTRLSVNIAGDTMAVIASASDSALAITNAPSSQQGVAGVRVFINEHPYDVPDGGALLDAFGFVDISTLPEGRHTLYVQATDNGGYKGPVTAAYFTKVALPSAHPSEVPTGSLQPTLVPSDIPSTVPSKPPPGICFSGDTKVMVKDVGSVLMRDLQLGNHVKVSLTDEIYQPVYSFGHRNNSTADSVEFLRLYPSMLELSSSHMVFVEGKGALPSSLVQVGDSLVGSDDPVSKIQKVFRRSGIFAPFTPSGTIVVNGVLASSYVALQDSPVLYVGPVSSGLSFQWLAHTFQLPHRIWCVHLGSCQDERYTTDGISTWVEQPLYASQWLLKQNTYVSLFLLAPVVLFFVFLSLGEAMTSCPSRTLFLGAIVCAALTNRLRASAKHMKYTKKGC